MSANFSINKQNKAIWVFFSILPKYLLVALTIIMIVIVAFMPLIPSMPAAGLDNSWLFFMSEAMAQHLNFGKDIIFTFGPYASIYTGQYNAATNFLMLSSSLFFGLCYAITLLCLLSDKKINQLQFALLLVYIIMFLAPQTDALLFSYPLILAVVIANNIHQIEQKIKIWQLLIMFLIFAPLGLLPLIKGSLLPLCIAVSISISCYFLYHRTRALSMLALTIPILSMPIFWVLSGQSISFLPSYLSTQVPIISGYAQAMGQSGGNIEAITYLLGGITIIWTLMTENKITLATRLFLSACFFLFLFIAFKAGFTQYDGFSGSPARSAISMIFAALIIRFISVNTIEIYATAYYPQYKRNILLLILTNLWFFWRSQRLTEFVIPIILGIYICMAIPPKIMVFTREIIDFRIRGGLNLRLSEYSDNYFKSQFEQSLGLIRQEYSIPHLQGTTDIYPWDQSYLLASDNQWNPRPIMQSYSAYTPLLAQANEQHLRGDKAPDNIVFGVKTIGGRFPTLDDGLSWPALLDNYTLNKIDNDFKFAYLRKKPTLQKNSDFHVLHDEIHKIKENVLIPSTNDFVYAEINLKPTLLGKLWGMLYKPPHLLITLKLKNGGSAQYQVIANMVETGFFISPLIRDTKDFAIVSSGGAHYLNANTVESFTISTVKGGRLFWNSNYDLKLKAYQMHATNNAFAFPFDKIIEHPEKYTTASPIHCELNQLIEQVSGISTAQPNPTVTSLLTVNGWLVSSLKDGVAADETFVTITDNQGSVKYIKTHPTARPDVKIYFKQPALPEDVGFIASVDVTKLQGNYKLGLARVHAGKLEQCLETVIPITIKPTQHHEPQ
jgi:hypothetical protein